MPIQRPNRIFREGGFNLRKCVTNSIKLQLRIDCAQGGHDTSETKTTERSQDESYWNTTLEDSPHKKSEELKVLGVRWKPCEDHFIFYVGTINQLANTLEPTKENVISIIGRLFDPLGFLALVIIPFKMFFQRLCECKIEWDQTLPEELVGA